MITKETTPKETAQEIFDNMCQTISSDCEHDSYCSRKECTWKGITYCIVSKNEAKQCALNACEIAVTDLAFVCGSWPCVGLCGVSGLCVGPSAVLRGKAMSLNVRAKHRACVRALC